MAYQQDVALAYAEELKRLGLPDTPEVYLAFMTGHFRGHLRVLINTSWNKTKYYWQLVDMQHALEKQWALDNECPTLPSFDEESPRTVYPLAPVHNSLS